MSTPALPVGFSPEGELFTSMWMPVSNGTTASPETESAGPTTGPSEINVVAVDGVRLRPGRGPPRGSGQTAV